jgi:hypothetical protein
MPRPDRNREAQALHKRRMREVGFVRLNLWVHPDLQAEIARLRRPGECRGRTLERLILGAARNRPEFSPTAGIASPGESTAYPLSQCPAESASATGEAE